MVLPTVQLSDAPWMLLEPVGCGGSLVTTLQSCKHLAVTGAALEPSLGSVAIVAVCFAFLSSPDGSYTEEQSQESEVKVLATDFDDEFDDEEPLPAIGTCKALYTFEGNTDCLRPSSLSVVRLSFEAFRTFLSGLFHSARSICDSDFFLVDGCIFCLWVRTIDQLSVSLISADGME